MKRTTLAVGLSLASWVTGNTGPQACSCGEPPGPKAALESAAAVFAGEVEQIELDFTRDGYPAAYLVTFRVERQWKGEDSSRAIVETGLGGGDCGFRFARGKKYLVYAFGQSRLGTGICSRTRALADATEDFAALGPPPNEVDPR